MATIYVTVTPNLSVTEEWAKSFAAINENLVALCTADVRNELEEKNGVEPSNQVLFEEMSRRTKSLLSQGKSVVYVATSASSKTRMGLLKEKFVRDAQKVAVYFDIPLQEVVESTEQKEYVKKIVKGVNVPFYGEGWDAILVVHSEYAQDKVGEIEQKLFGKKLSHEELYSIAGELSEKFGENYNFSYGNPEQKLSVSERTHLEFETLKERFPEKKALLWAALLRNTGMAFCKEVLEDGKYRFSGSENIAAQTAMTVLHHVGYEDEFALRVATLISQMARMRENQEKTRGLVGEEIYSQLQILQNQIAESRN